MELSHQIKKYRHQFNISQEALAEKIYVSRQTISNWENDKSYPDIHSLVLLSEIFHISLDELVKGDIEMMKEVISKVDVSKFNKYSLIFTCLFIFTIVSAVPLFLFLEKVALIPWGIIYTITMIFAFKIEKMKKNYDIQTYKEIVAFSEGRRLDEIQKQREIGKRNYQVFFKIIISALVTAFFCIMIGLIMHLFLN